MQSKETLYKEMTDKAAALIGAESDLIATLANISALLKETFGWLWVGFYLKSSEHEMVLGPFQGPIACTRIQMGKGVCGTAWKEARTIVVPDVHQFPGHIACSSLSQSEIVVPIFRNGTFKAVLDIDSEHHRTFDETDRLYLEHLCALLNF